MDKSITTIDSQSTLSPFPKPIIVLKYSNIFTNIEIVTFEIALALGELTSESGNISITDSGKELLFKIEITDPFELSKVNAKRANWNFYRITLKKEFMVGEHSLSLRWVNIAGKAVTRRNLKIVLDKTPPQIKWLSPARNGYNSSPLFVDVLVDDVQIPPILKREIIDLNELGTIKANRLSGKGIKNLLDVFSLGHASLYIGGGSSSDSLDLITKVNFIQQFTVDPETFNGLLNFKLNTLAFSSIENIIQKSTSTKFEAKKFLGEIRVIHSFFDKIASNKIYLRDFLKRPHSGLESFELFLDDVEVTSDAMRDENRIKLSTKNISGVGAHTLKLFIKDKAGNCNTSYLQFLLDKKAPQMTILSPVNESYLASKTVQFDVRVSDLESGVNWDSAKLWVNEKSYPLDMSKPLNSIQRSITFTKEGRQELKFECKDFAGNLASAKSIFTIDLTSPKIEIDTDLDATTTFQQEVEISGKAFDVNLAKVLVVKTPVEIDIEGNFKAIVNLVPGVNAIHATAIDTAGNTSYSPSISVTYIEKKQTGVSGMVQNPDGEAVSGVHIIETKSGLATLSNSNGKFSLNGIPEGQLILEIAPSGNKYVRSTFSIVTKYGNYIQLEKPITLLPTLSSADMKAVESESGSSITNSRIEGMELSYTQDVTLEFPKDAGQDILIDLVSTESLPMPIPDFIPSGQVARLEPSGLKVTGEKSISLTLPNNLGAEAGTKLPLLTYDGLTGKWSLGGMCAVSDDGKTVKTLPGMGIRHFSLAVAVPLGPSIEVVDESTQSAGGDSLNGGLETSLSLPGFVDMSKKYSPTLIYSSRAAAPRVRATAIFRGMKEVTNTRKVYDKLAVDIELKGKRIMPLYNYSAFLRFRPIAEYQVSGTTQRIYLYRQVNEHLYELDTRVELPPIFVPDGGVTPVIPMPETVYIDNMELRLAGNLTQERPELFYEIKIRNTVNVHTGMWPESITSRCLFSDQDTGEFTTYGAEQKIGPEPMPGETDNREIFSRLPENTVINYSLFPRSPSGIYYPTGLYNFFAKYQVNARTYQMTQAAVFAESAFANEEWLNQLKSSLGQLGATERADTEHAIATIEKAMDLRWHGPEYQSQFQYNDPLGLLMQNQAGTIAVHNLVHSDFGRGWRLAELQRVYPVGLNRVLVVDTQGRHTFTVADRINKVFNGNYGVLGKSSNNKLIAAITKLDPDLDLSIDDVNRTSDIVGSTIHDLISSNAYRKLYPTDPEFIRALFTDLIQREPNTEEQEEWETKLNTSRNLDIFLIQFFRTSLFLNSLASTFIQPLLKRPATENELISLTAKIFISGAFVWIEHLITELVSLDVINETYLNDKEFVKVVLDNFSFLSKEEIQLSLEKETAFCSRVGRARFFKYRAQPWFRHHAYHTFLKLTPFVDNGVHLISAGKIEKSDIQLEPVNIHTKTLPYRENKIKGSSSTGYWDIKANTPSHQSNDDLSLWDGMSINPDPKGIAVADNGDIFISDAATHRIYSKSERGSLITLGFADTNDYFQGVGVIKYYDNNNNLLDITDDKEALNDNRVAYRRYSVNVQQGLGTGGRVQAGESKDGTYYHKRVWLDSPGGLEIDAEGCLIFAETGNNRVRKYDLEKNELTTLIGSDSEEYKPGINQANTVGLLAPIDIALTPEGDLFVLFNPVGEQQAICKLDRNGHFSHVAGSPYLDQGTIDVGVDAKFYKMLGATAITTNKLGQIFVTMKDQNIVLIVTPDGYIDTVAGNGNDNPVTGDGGPANQASISSPVGIITDSSGNLIISDSGHRSLRLISLGTNDGIIATEFIGPRGHYKSKLIHQTDGTWVRQFQDGSNITFNNNGLQTALIDKNGNKTEYLYDYSKLKEVKYPGGSFLKFEYQNDKLQSITDHAGRNTSFQVLDGNLVTVDYGNENLNFSYDNDGQLQKAILKDGREIEYFYDQNGHLISGDPETLSITPPADGATQKQTTANPNHSATTVSFPEIGDVSYKVENGKLTEYFYGMKAFRINYNVDMLPETINRSSGSVVKFSYNSWREVVSKYDSFLNAEMTTAYNQKGHPVKSVQYGGIEADYQYDLCGNIIEKTIQDKSLLTQKWDDRGLLTHRKTKGTLLTRGYDDKGNIEKIIQGSATINLTRDKRGNIEFEQWGTSPQREFKYDSWNRLISVNEQRGVTQFKYNEKGFLYQMIDPDLGISQYLYDEVGNLTQSTDSNSVEWYFFYDDSGRLAMKISSGNEYTSYTYPNPFSSNEYTQGEIVERLYTLDGSLMASKSDYIDFIRSFDDAGRLVSEEWTLLSDQPLLIELALDLDGKITTIKSKGDQVDFSHDEIGQLEEVTAASFKLFISRDEANRTNQLKFNDQGKCDFGFNEHGELFSTSYSLGATKTYSEKILYADTGNISQITENEVVTTYDYDDDQQLTKTQTGDTVNNITYDKTGNRIKDARGDYLYSDERLLIDCPLFTYRYNGNAKLVEKTDKNNGEVHFYSYSNQGLLNQYRRLDSELNLLTEAIYVFDPNGRRIYKSVRKIENNLKVESRFFIYHGDDVLLELDEDLNVKRQYISGHQVDAMMGFIEQGKSYYYVKNSLGSIVRVVDEIGETVCSYSYDAFGKLLTKDEKIENRYLYTGREWDEESETYYFRNRTYDPLIGRFYQPDPDTGVFNWPISMINKYTYVWNNPLRYSDPLGLSSSDPLGVSLISDGSGLFNHTSEKGDQFIIYEPPTSQPESMVFNDDASTFTPIDQTDPNEPANNLNTGYQPGVTSQWVRTNIDLNSFKDGLINNTTKALGDLVKSAASSTNLSSNNALKITGNISDLSQILGSTLSPATGWLVKGLQSLLINSSDIATHGLPGLGNEFAKEMVGGNYIYPEPKQKPAKVAWEYLADLDALNAIQDDVLIEYLKEVLIGRNAISRDALKSANFIINGNKITVVNPKDFLGGNEITVVNREGVKLLHFKIVCPSKETLG